ncbi:MAG: hypothetical protein ACPG77_21295, partial [Nannocystaceae bacterium]
MPVRSRPRGLFGWREAWGAGLRGKWHGPTRVAGSWPEDVRGSVRGSGPEDEPGSPVRKIGLEDARGSGVRGIGPEDGRPGVRGIGPGNGPVSGVRGIGLEDAPGSGVRRVGPEDASVSGVRGIGPEDGPGSGVRGIGPEDALSSTVRGIVRFAKVHGDDDGKRAGYGEYWVAALSRPNQRIYRFATKWPGAVLRGWAEGSCWDP